LSANSTTCLFSKKFNNLFVKNFPKENFSEDELKTLFEPFGEIVSVKVFQTEASAFEEDESGEELAPVAKDKSSRQGYGFVCFARCEDARKALEHFHEKGDESSVSTEVQNTSSRGDDSTIQ